MRRSTTSQLSARCPSRKASSSSPTSGRMNNFSREATSSAMDSERATGSALLQSSDAFEIVADGNADVLEEIITFSGAKYMAKLRSKKAEDFGRNLLHCAVANGQLKPLQVLLKHKVFDPNQVDSAYTRSTPLMEAVKIGGRLDLIECLIAAGSRLDVQDVNGDSALHWAARETSAAFLRQLLQLARKHGRTVPQLLAALQLKNNSGENAADVGANDVARESIRRLVSGEEPPGLPARKSNSTGSRPNRASLIGTNKNVPRPACAAVGGGDGGGGWGAERSGQRPRESETARSTGLSRSQSRGPSGTRPRSAHSGNPPGGGVGVGSQGNEQRPRSGPVGSSDPRPIESLNPKGLRPRSAQPRNPLGQQPNQLGNFPGLRPNKPEDLRTTGGARLTGMPPGVVLGALAAAGEGAGKGGQPTTAAAGTPALLQEQAIHLPKVKCVVGSIAGGSGEAYAPTSTDGFRDQCISHP